MRAKILESTRAQKDLGKAPVEVLQAYEIWARLIEEHGIAILREFKGYHDEKLRGNWGGCRSSRLNRKWRVIYAAHKEGQLEIVGVERVTPHKYRRK